MSWGRVKKSLQNITPKKPKKTNPNTKTRLTSTPLQRQQPHPPHELYNEVENYLAIIKKKIIEVGTLHQEAMRWAKKVRDEKRKSDIQIWKNEQLSKAASAPKKVSFAEDTTENPPKDLIAKLPPDRPDHANKMREHPFKYFSLTETFTEDTTENPPEDLITKLPPDRPDHANEEEPPLNIQYEDTETTDLEISNNEVNDNKIDDYEDKDNHTESSSFEISTDNEDEDEYYTEDSEEYKDDEDTQNNLTISEENNFSNITGTKKKIGRKSNYSQSKHNRDSNDEEENPEESCDYTEENSNKENRE